MENKNLFERLIDHHVDTWEKFSIFMGIIYMVSIITLILILKVSTVSGNVYCYYERYVYKRHLVLGSIPWRVDRIVFGSENYEEVKEFLLDKRMCN